MSKVFVIGGGAWHDGSFAARNGHQVTIFEKNGKLGKKLFITGKGRCNITNACDYDTFQNIITNPKFYLAPFLTSIILMLWISLKVLVFH